jgi:hypothetical protein
MSSTNMRKTDVDGKTAKSVFTNHLKFIQHIYSSRKSTGYINWLKCHPTEIDQIYEPKGEIKIIHSSK